MEVIDIGLSDLEPVSFNLQEDKSMEPPSVNFGPGLELLMNDKKINSSYSTKVDVSDLDNLESELNDLSKNVEFGGDVPFAPPVVKSAWDKAISVGNNWYHLEWFGYFFKIEGNNWIYHETLGWMYTEWTTTFESIWLYHDILGWVWTKHDLFPYLYNPTNASWVYLVKGGHYDFAKNAWIAQTN